MGLVLAYGGFDFASPDGDVGRTVGHLMRIVMMGLVAYVPASAIVQYARHWNWVGLVVFVGMAMVFATQLSVMGEYGPAHVAMDVGVWVFPALLGVLVGKFVVVVVRGRRVLADAAAKQA